VGYRIVAWDGRQAYSLYDKQPVNFEVGETIQSKTGIYLGSTPEFAIDFYSNLTDMQDRLLTVKFDMKDLIHGDPSQPMTELIVRRGTIVASELLRDTK